MAMTTIETTTPAYTRASEIPSSTIDNGAATAVGQSPGAALDRSLVHGLAWTGSIKWAGQLLSWATTIIVARLLTPSDYGLVGMAALYLTLANLLSEFGMGAAVITLRELTQRQIAEINSVSVLFGVGVFCLSGMVASPLAWFFNAPELRLVVIAMSTTFLINGFKTVPSSLMQRDLEFKRIALIDGVQTVVLSLGTLVPALLGFGYWTLVVGAILSAMVATVLTVSQRPFPFARPTFALLRNSLTLSWHVLLQRVSFFAYSDSDFLVVGKLIGRVALGAYNFAWTLANVPIEKVTSLVTAITPAIFSAAQSDRSSLRRYFLGISEGIAYVTLPTTVGLAIVAPELVRLVLGERWLTMVSPLRLLAVYACVRSLTPLLMQLANVIGESRFGARSNVLAAIALPLGFLVGSRWGTAGVAMAWILVHPLVIVIPMTRRIFARLELPFSVYLMALWPAMSGTLVMTLTVLGSQYALSASLSLGTRLAIEIAVGALTYASILVTAHRARLRALLATWKSIRP